MSYILDALKRADAERERGAVPGLQSRHATLPAAETDRRARNYLWLAAAVLALGGMAAGVWLWQTPSGTERLAAVAPAVVTPPPLVPPVPSPIVSMPASPPAVVAPRVVASSPPVVNRVAPKPAPKPAPAASAAAVQPQPKPKTEPVAKAAASQAAPPAVRLLGDLPEDLRRQIPPLLITGSVYSNNPDKRLLLVNNQVLPQGSLAAPGVTLEQIQAKSSVFSYQGTRFRVAH
ncbi:general secretion pathway protein GspB [Polaromonas sp. DSR2-3-2]|uniref:general secretion pathway protein GspB n=1 Tax=unclassified Polaromonas TaxID=2638319 RepID=UPI003CF5F226